MGGRSKPPLPGRVGPQGGRGQNYRRFVEAALWLVRMDTRMYAC